MRIIIAHSHLTSLGGGERTTLELLKHLSRRHDVQLWTSKYRPQSTFGELDDFPRRILHTREWLTLRPDADVVISQTFGANLLALRHPRTLCYLHTLRSRYLLAGQRPDLLLRRLLDRAALDSAARLYTNSAYAAGKIAAIYGKPATVLPPGVESAYLHTPTLCGDYALYVGRLAPEKGIERLLRWSRSLPLDLLVIGDGDSGYVRYLRAMADDRTRFAGPLTGDALQQVYSGCRYLAFLPYAEEFGLVVLEAMAAAKPVLASRDGALMELVQEGATGFLVETAGEFRAAAHRLAESDALCLRLGEQGREVARAFTWQRFGEGIEEACLELTAGEHSDSQGS
jgi:glycosyltransferase involved in cell wall biosynthesis